MAESRHFMELLTARFAAGYTVCIGLDTDMAKIPNHNYPLPVAGEVLDEGHHRTLGFNGAIIDATRGLVAAYKPNSAFYEGDRTMMDLELTIQYIHEVAPEVPVIIDAKRGDIDNTNLGYVRSAFDHLDADAITVHPYLGRRALRPFLDQADKGIIVLCRTSNEEGGEFQDRLVTLDHSEEIEFFRQFDWVTRHELLHGGMIYLIPFYLLVAYRVSRYWNQLGNCGLVVGATYPEELRLVRLVAPDIPLLIPGIGAQGGDLEATVRNGCDTKGQGMIINSSRGIIYAEDPRAATLELDGRIRQLRNAV